MGGTTNKKFTTDPHRFTHLSTNAFSSPMRLCGLILLLALGAFAQAPTVEKVDPPSWWTGSTITGLDPDR